MYTCFKFNSYHLSLFHSHSRQNFDAHVRHRILCYTGNNLLYYRNFNMHSLNLPEWDTKLQYYRRSDVIFIDDGDGIMLRIMDVLMVL